MHWQRNDQETQAKWSFFYTYKYVTSLLVPSDAGRLETPTDVVKLETSRPV
jgi:hypothetical protein